MSRARSYLSGVLDRNAARLFGHGAAALFASLGVVLGVTTPEASDAAWGLLGSAAITALSAEATRGRVWAEESVRRVREEAEARGAAGVDAATVEVARRVDAVLGAGQGARLLELAKARGMTAVADVIDRAVRDVESRYPVEGDPFPPALRGV